MALFVATVILLFVTTVFADSSAFVATVFLDSPVFETTLSSDSPVFVTTVFMDSPVFVATLPTLDERGKQTVCKSVELKILT